MSDRPSVYIAGPMRGHEYNNHFAFDEAAEFLNGLGYFVFSPAQMDRDQGSDLSKVNTMRSPERRKVFERDIAALTKCDAIYMLNGWRGSPGAKAERAVAEAVGIMVIEQ